MLVRAAVTTLLAILGSALAACQPSRAPSAHGDDPNAGQRVAVFEGQAVTQGELDAWIKDDLFRSQTEDLGPAEIFDLRSRSLDRMLEERALQSEARKRGLSVDDLLKSEREKRGGISDEQVTAFYQSNKQRMGDATRDQVADRIRSYLEGQRDREIKADLRKQAKIEVLLEPPRITVAASGPAVGPASAPVTVIEFSDFQCPFCGRAAAISKQLHERYPTQVRFVYRHLPLERIHPFARGAAEAAVCADAQGRFWEYHDKLFANQRALTPADLQSYAKELGLDTAAFDACVKDGKAKDQVDRDLADAATAADHAGKRGLGTPAFFVNGILLSGAQPPEEFYRLIDAELARAGEAVPAAAAKEPAAGS